MVFRDSHAIIMLHSDENKSNFFGVFCISTLASFLDSFVQYFSIIFQSNVIIYDWCSSYNWFLFFDEWYESASINNHNYNINSIGIWIKSNYWKCSTPKLPSEKKRHYIMSLVLVNKFCGSTFFCNIYLL